MTLVYEKKGHIAYLRLNRPEVHNALNAEMLCDLADAWEDYQLDANLRCAILTGTGEKTFCSGADLGTLTTLGNGSRKPQSPQEERVLREGYSLVNKATLRDYELFKPVIAALNGTTLAGGLELVLAADIRVAADHAKFGLPEVKRATMPSGGSTVRLPKMIPRAIAMEMMLTGEYYTAQQAREWGLVNSVVPGAQVMQEAERYANLIAKNGPIAVQLTKRSVIEGEGMPVSYALAHESDINKLVLSTEDAREGPSAFKEKREPVYTGR